MGHWGKIPPGFETIFGRFTLDDNGKLGSTAVTMVITMVNCKKIKWYYRGDVQMRKTIINYGHNTAVDVTLFTIFEWMKRRTVKRIMNTVLRCSFSLASCLAIPYCMASRSEEHTSELQSR